jgi:hypothetical protein
MDRVVAFVRTKRSKQALRKEMQRKKQQDNGRRQINLSVPDNDRSRATMRGAAIAIEDEVSHQAIESLLDNERLRPLVVGVAARPELHETIDLIQQGQATTTSLNAARLVIGDPDLAALVERATATSRMREAMEMAAANPEFVFFGRNAATERSLPGGSLKIVAARAPRTLRGRQGAKQKGPWQRLRGLGEAGGPAGSVPVARPQEGGMRRGAEAGFTTHELMAKSGHKSLAEVQRYTEAANKKKLADSGAAKLREAAAMAPKRITDQSANAAYTNIEARLHKHEPKPLKTKRWQNEMARHSEQNYKLACD